MKRQTPFDAINRVMNALRYSLANYLRFARPWSDVRGQSIAETIGCVADGQTRHVMRIGDLLVKRHGHVESRAFPKAFTGLNDLSVEYLLPLVIEDEKQIVRLVEASAAALEGDREASDLLAEIIECEKEHLQRLERSPVHSRAMMDRASIPARHRTYTWPTANWNPQLRTSPSWQVRAMALSGL